jgi:hypothetical protein
MHSVEPPNQMRCEMDNLFNKPTNNFLSPIVHPNKTTPDPIIKLDPIIPTYQLDMASGHTTIGHAQVGPPRYIPLNQIHAPMK